MQDVSRGVCAAERITAILINRCDALHVFFNLATGQITMMNDQAGMLLSIGHTKLKAVAFDHAGISDLATRLGIEGCRIEHDAHRCWRIHLGRFGMRQQQSFVLVAFTIAGNDPFNNRLADDFLITDKRSLAQRFL